MASRGRLQILGVDGGETRELEGLPRNKISIAVAFSPDGRRVAAAPLDGPAKEKRIRVWDLETDAVRVLEPVSGADDVDKGGFVRIRFVDESRIVATADAVGLMLFDLPAASYPALRTRSYSGDR